MIWQQNDDIQDYITLQTYMGLLFCPEERGQRMFPYVNYKTTTSLPQNNSFKLNYVSVYSCSILNPLISPTSALLIHHNHNFFIKHTLSFIPFFFQYQCKFFPLPQEYSQMNSTSVKLIKHSNLTKILPLMTGQQSHKGLLVQIRTLQQFTLHPNKLIKAEHNFKDIMFKKMP